MAKTHLITRALVFLGITVAAACNTESTTSPTGEPGSSQLAAEIAQTQFGDLNSYGWASVLAGVPNAPAPAFDPGLCPYLSTDQSFTCAQRTESGFTFQLKYFLYGTGGQALSQPDANAASSLRTVLDVHGSPSLPAGSATASIALNHHSDMTVSGLLGATRTVNGTSWDRDTLVARRDSVRTVLSVIGTTKDLVLPSGTSKYPASGTITSDITASTQLANVLEQSLLRAELKFAGTNIALLTLSDGLGVTTCRIDLAGVLPPRCP